MYRGLKQYTDNFVLLLSMLHLKTHLYKKVSKDNTVFVGHYMVRETTILWSIKNPREHNVKKKIGVVEHGPRSSSNNWLL